MKIIDQDNLAMYTDNGGLLISPIPPLTLILCSIELALGKKAQIKVHESIDIGGLRIKLGELNQIQGLRLLKPSTSYIPFHDVLEKNNWHHAVRNKVVILAYDGPNIHRVKTPLGPMGAHRLFVTILYSLLSNGS